MSKLSPKIFKTMKDYSKEQFVKDVTAGVIVAIIALPLSIALAISSGVSPEKGIYTAIVAGFLISFLGGSRVQIGGPTGAFMVIVYGIVAKHGIEGLAIATVLAGVMMILMGLLRLGSVIKYIPYPVTTGFTSGIAVVIFSSQIKDFFGLKIDNVPADFIDKWSVYFKNVHTFNWQALLVGAVALAIIIFWPRVSRKIPGAFIALIVTSAAVKFLGMDVETIGTRYGEISAALPVFHAPQITLSKISELILPAFTIAVLGSIESLLSAVVSDGMIGGKHRSNMELVAQGTANIASALFGGIPATGAIARTVANVKNGGRTPVAGMVHSVTLLLILVLFMPFVKLVPLASLAAVLIVVAYNMSEWREFKGFFKSPKSDIAVLLLVFVLTVVIDLVKAIEIGLILAAFLFMKRMTDVSNVSNINMDASEEESENFDFAQESKRIACPRYIQVYEINGPFFFGATDKFLTAMESLDRKTETLIIRMRNVPAMDATALKAFRSVIKNCKRKHISLLITGINPQPLEVLKKTGIFEIIGENHFFYEVEDAINYAKNRAVN